MAATMRLYGVAGKRRMPVAVPLRRWMEAQKLLTLFQINVLVAMCRDAVKLRANDLRPRIVAAGLAPADEVRLRSLFPTPPRSPAGMLALS